jgi:hemoglobin
MSETDTARSKFERIGGGDTVERLVEAFYGRMESLPEAQDLRAVHAPDLTATKLALKKYLTEWLGGPNLYSVEKGHPRLRRRHLYLKIGEAERDAWLLCMQGALAATVADVELREEIYEPLAKLADWMRNQPDSPHAARTVLSKDCS